MTSWWAWSSYRSASSQRRAWPDDRTRTPAPGRPSGDARETGRAGRTSARDTSTDVSGAGDAGGTREVSRDRDLCAARPQPPSTRARASRSLTLTAPALHSMEPTRVPFPLHRRRRSRRCRRAPTDPSLAATAPRAPTPTPTTVSPTASSLSTLPRRRPRSCADPVLGRHLGQRDRHRPRTAEDRQGGGRPPPRASVTPTAARRHCWRPSATATVTTACSTAMPATWRAAASARAERPGRWPTAPASGGR